MSADKTVEKFGKFSHLIIVDNLFNKGNARGFWGQQLLQKKNPILGSIVLLLSINFETLARLQNFHLNPSREDNKNIFYSFKFKEK